MPMKKFLCSLLVVAAGLLSTACHDEIIQKLDELENRTDELLLKCNQLNENLGTLQNLVEVIQRQDMITGITEIRSGNTVTGYRVNFVQHEPITIYNGSDGKKPLVASRQDPDNRNYYWTVQYGDDDWDWLYALDGNRMLAVGVLPYVTIRNGKFVLSTDGGSTWIELGKANGEDGDQMFKSIDTSNENYVTITLTTGEVFKIPTYSAFLALKIEYDKANEAVDAQVEIIRATQEKLTWITSIDPILDGNDTTGLTVSLSNGQHFSIHDWKTTLSPAIFIKRDTDGHLYWAYTIGLSPETWVLTPEGKKVPAETGSVETPLVSVTRDTDGQYYWVVITRDSTEFLRTKIDGNWQPRAIDSVQRIFMSVDNYADSLVLVLKDSTRFVLPKQYSITFSDADGKPINGIIPMKGKTEAVVRYQASGNNPSLSLLTQGGISASPSKLENGDPCFVVKTDYGFSAETARIVAVFTFPEAVSPVTIVKTFTVSKE